MLFIALPYYLLVFLYQFNYSLIKLDFDYCFILTCFCLINLFGVSQGNRKVMRAPKEGINNSSYMHDTINCYT